MRDLPITGRMETLASLRIFDNGNHLLSESKPGKVNVDAGKSTLSTWQIPLAALRPGAIYRVDVALDGDPVWRSYFRIAQ